MTSFALNSQTFDDHWKIRQKNQRKICNDEPYFQN